MCSTARLGVCPFLAGGSAIGKLVAYAPDERSSLESVKTPMGRLYGWYSSGETW